MSRYLPAMTVAREIHSIATDVISPLQLIKISYITHGWAYPCLERQLINDHVEAWKYGPVYSELYHSLKHNGREPVDFVPLSIREQKDGKEISLEEDEKELIEVIYNGYKNLTGSQLITLTHKKGTPWDQADSAIIDESVIKAYYIKEAERIRNG